MKRLKVIVLIVFTCLIVTTLCVFAAYHHMGEADSGNFLAVYPYTAGTKLDNCATCHCGGVVKGVYYNSCNWCHYTYKTTAPHGDITATLNGYGKDYLAKGRNQAALTSIESLDSDGDGYSNIVEIKAIRYPGDASDDPTKVTASYRIYNKAQLQRMPQHSQFMLMNTSKSGDYYTTYSGVIMQDLLKTAGIAASATGITVYAPDGFGATHPLEASNALDINSYYVNGSYPAATYFYDKRADKAYQTDQCGQLASGWCDYSSPGNSGRNNGAPIAVDGGLRMILALQVDGNDLVPGYLDSSGKLASGTEGPFRVVPPQKNVGPPDQASNAACQNVLWPYDANADHNAGQSTKSTTIIQVNPLPDWATGVEFSESGWDFVEQGKIVIFGALQGPTLVSPAGGAQNVPTKQTVFTWTPTTDPDPSAAVTYTVEYSKDKVTWTPLTPVVKKVASTGRSGWTSYAGTGTFMFFGICGAVAVGGSRRRWNYLAVFLMLAVTGAVLTSCSGDDNGPPPVATVSTTSTQTLDPNTTYYWRVTGDGPSSHLVSDVSSFKTGQ